MPLPRFTQGKLGNLEFSHLNQVFDAIEGVSESRAPARFSAKTGRVFLAKISGKQGSGASEQGSFTEVSRDSLATTVYADVVGGVTSTGVTGAFDNPIVAPVSAVGTVVPVLGHTAKDGTLYFRECAGASAAGATFMAEVISSAGAPPVFGYTLSRRKRSGSAWVTTGEADITAFNGAENAVDDTANRIIGVGSIHVAGSTATRKPIRTGTIVMVTEIEGAYCFSMPNGYEFACV